MTRDGEGNARQVDGSRIDTIRQRDEDGDGQGIGGVEDTSDPARLTVAELPFADEARQKSRPCVGSDLCAYLRRAYAGDEASGR